MMMKRRMQKHPWNTDRTSLLVFCDFTFLPSCLSVVHEISKVPFFNGFPLSPAYQRLNLKSTDMHKRAALKAAVSSISFSQLFNAFTEISPYLSNASLNLLDRSLLRNEFQSFTSQQQQKLSTFEGFFTSYAHPRLVSTSKHTRHIQTTTQREHVNYFSSSSVRLQERSPLRVQSEPSHVRVTRNANFTCSSVMLSLSAFNFILLL